MDPRCTSPRLRTSYLLASLLLATTFLGCGTGAYEDAFDRRLSEVKQRTSEAVATANILKKLYAPDTFALETDKALTLRFPDVFKEQYTEDSSHKNDDGDQINPDRVQPPFLKLPGFKTCWEAFHSEGERDEAAYYPYYCYVAVTPVNEPAGEGEEDEESEDIEQESMSPKAELLAAMQEKFPDQEVAWEEIYCPTPDDRVMVWDRLVVEVEQPFLVTETIDSEGVTASQELPGHFHLCLYEGFAYNVIVAWRVPQIVIEAGAFDLDRVEPVCLGTLTGAD